MVSLPKDGVLFDIRCSGAFYSLWPPWETEVETIHLNSGYYIEVPKDIALGRPPGESEPEQSGQEKAGEEGQEYIKGSKGIALGRPPGGNNQQQAGQGKAGEEGQEGPR